MGTRSSIMVIHKDEIKISQYSQWDGYPTGVGKSILDILNDQNFDIIKFKQNLDNINPLTSEEIKSINEDSNWPSKYPQFNRETGPDILKMILDGKIDKVLLLSDFVYDSLFCEWAYVIDLDKELLEIYKGFNKYKLDKSERFYKDDPNNKGYYACKLFGIFSLKNLPSQFSSNGDEDIAIFENQSTINISDTLRHIKRQIKITKLTKNEE